MSKFFSIHTVFFLIYSIANLVSPAERPSEMPYPFFSYLKNQIDFFQTFHDFVNFMFIDLNFCGVYAMGRGLFDSNTTAMK